MVLKPHRMLGRILLEEGTWPAGWPGFFRIPIDHVLITEDVAVAGFDVLPPAGSDHRALRVALLLP